MKPRRKLSIGWGGLACGFLLLLPLGACRPDDQATRSLDPQGSATRAQLPPELVEALDSGTVAFREHRFEDALSHYQRAADLEPDHPGGWFGVSMAQEALGNRAEAEAALQKVRDLAPGASMVHPEPDTADQEAEGGVP